MTQAPVFLAILVLIIGTGCAGRSDVRLLGDGQGVELGATPFFAQEKYQCGPAALAMLLGASGIDVHPDDLVPAAYLPGRRGSLQVEMAAAVRRMGRIPYPVLPDLSGITSEIRSGRPVLVLQNLGLKRWPVYHYAVVIGVQPPDRVVLRSGTRKRVEMAAARFNSTWQRAGSWGFIALLPGDFPENPDTVTYISAVAAFESAGNHAAAETAYQAALEVWPDHPAVRFALANSFLGNKKHAAAIQLYQGILASDPDHVAAANNLAEALVQSGKMEEARRVIHTAVTTAKKINSPLVESVEQTRREIEQALIEQE